MKHTIILILLGFFISFGAMAERSLVLARAPQMSASVISELWSPFVSHLSATTGIQVTLKVYTDRSEFETDINNGSVDLYFGNPGYGVVGHIKHGYIPLIRSDKKLLEGILVARKDSDIDHVEQLNGKLIAFPAETAFAASLYLRSLLTSDHNIQYEPLYTGSHDNAYRAVLIGKALAGGGVKKTLASEDIKIRDQLKIIYTTPGMKSHPLMIHPDVPIDIRQSVQTAILSMNADEAGKKLLKNVKLQNPVVANYLRDYKAIESFASNVYKYLLN